MADKSYIIRGRRCWCPVRGEDDDAAIVLSPEGSIVDAGVWPDISRQWPGLPVADAADALLIPGFVNAHSHLEYSLLRGALPEGPDFIQWLKGLVAAKRLSAPVDVDRAIPGAADEMAAGGARAVGEICASPAAMEPLLASGGIIGGRLYGEIISPSSRDWAARWSAFESVWTKIAAQGKLLPGISPHATFTIGPGNWQMIAEFRRAIGGGVGGMLPQAIHCSEWRAEVEMMQNGRGELFDFLNGLNLLDDDWSPPRCTPVEYLRRMRALDSDTLLIHCNYLEGDDIATIRTHGASVVVCPGTHRWFGHEGHLLRSLLDAGVNVCLGTDSLASNVSLAMPREMAMVRAMGPGLDLPFSDLLRMATVNGALALGLGHGWGTLQPGSPGGVVALKIDGAWSSVDDIDANQMEVSNPVFPGA